MEKRPLNGDDPISRFEPRWATPSVVAWMVALAAVVVVHHSGSVLLTHSEVFELGVCWLVGFFAFGAVVTAIAAARRRRRFRQAQLLSLCVVCGYDLRASAGTCPECGAKQPGTVVDAA